MTFGVTLAGFQTKRLADIQSETLDAFRQKFGQGFAIPDNSPEGQLKGILDERVSLIWELAEAVANSYNPAAAQGAQLDILLSLLGNVRKTATFSSLDSVIIRGTLATPIPSTFVASVLGNADARFKINQVGATINNPAVDEVQAIAFSATPTSGKFNIVFPEGTTADIAFGASAAAITTICEAVLGAGNIVVTGVIDDSTGLTLTYGAALGGVDRAEITISGNTLDAGGAVTATPSTVTEGTPPFSDPLNFIAEETGPVAAPAGSLTVIETPVAGIDSVTNLEDAELGRDIESDQDAKLRRAQEIQLAGAATPDAIRADLLNINDVTAVVIFENDTDITDSDGRPPHSLDIVVQGGDDQDIADRIWATRGGGIQTIGDITGTVVDSQGFNQTVKFSRPTEVDIWVEVDLITDLNYPSDGDDQVAALILAYGLSLSIGQDIIVYGSAPSLACSFDSIPGIRDFTIRVGKTASPTLDDNILIEPREISSFDSGRITVTSP